MINKAYETYNIYRCTRCNYFRWDVVDDIVGLCKATDLQVKRIKEFLLLNPPPDCGNWAKGKRSKKL